MERRLSKDQIARLHYVVPGYVWKQSKFSIDIESVKDTLVNQFGLIVVEGMDSQIREYAAAIMLGFIQELDYHVDVNWRTFYVRDADEFTGAVYYHPPHRVQVIAVRGPITPQHADQISDIASRSALTLLVCDVGAHSNILLQKQIYRVTAKAGKRTELWYTGKEL